MCWNANVILFMKIVYAYCKLGIVQYAVVQHFDEDFSV